MHVFGAYFMCCAYTLYNIIRTCDTFERVRHDTPRLTARARLFYYFDDVLNLPRPLAEQSCKINWLSCCYAVSTHNTSHCKHNETENSPKTYLNINICLFQLIIFMYIVGTFLYTHFSSFQFRARFAYI